MFSFYTFILTYFCSFYPLFKMIILAYLFIFLFTFLLGGGIGLIVQFGLLFILGKIMGMPKIMMNLGRYLLVGSYWGGVINGYFSFQIAQYVASWDMFSEIHFTQLTLAFALLLFFAIPLVNKLLSKDKPGAQANPMMQQFQQMQSMLGGQDPNGANKALNKGAIVGFIGKVVGLGIALINLFYF